jgi:hypothetical protein
MQADDLCPASSAPHVGRNSLKARSRRQPARSVRMIVSMSGRPVSSGRPSSARGSPTANSRRRALSASASQPNVVVALITAFSSRDTTAAREAGVRCSLVKPVDFSILMPLGLSRRGRRGAEWMRDPSIQSRKVHVLALIAGRIGIASAHVERELCCEDELNSTPS